MKRCALFPMFLVFATVSALGGCGFINSLGADDGGREREIADLQKAQQQKYAGIVATACDAYPAAFDASFEGCDTNPNNTTYCRPPTRVQLEAMAFRFAECDLWTEFFRRARRFPLDLQSDDTIWSSLDQRYPLLDRFVAVLQATDGLYRAPLGAANARAFATWLLAHAGAPACARIAAHQAALGPDGQFVFNDFYANAGCAEQALPIARRNLSHDHPDMRMQACTTIGMFGDTSDAEKLGLLALRDPFHREQDTASGRRITVHPVREICAAAANKLLLR